MSVCRLGDFEQRIGLFIIFCQQHDGFIFGVPDSQCGILVFVWLCSCISAACHDE